MNKIDKDLCIKFLTTLSTREYTKLSHPEFRRIKAFIMSDGCTMAPELYHTACIIHDFYYRTHIDLYGNPLTKGQADKLFRKHIQHNSSLGRVSITAFIWFQAVKFFGRRSWN